MNSEPKDKDIQGSNISSQEDYIDLRQLFSILWQGKWIIIAITFVFALCSVGLALYLPNEYKATVVVKANDSSGGKLGQLAGQFGGLASLAGINLDDGGTTESVVATEILKSWDFAEKFIDKHDIEVALFAAEDWKQETNQLAIDSTIYDKDAKKWVREAPKGKTVEPTSWELYVALRERLSVSENPETGLISISVTHYSPFLAQKWVTWLVQDINRFMRERALNDTEKNIQYLEQQFRETSYAELRKVFSELIQEEQKNKMLAQVSEEYIFKTVSAAKVPEERDKPNRALIAIVGTLLGGFLSVLIVLVMSVFRRD